MILIILVWNNGRSTDNVRLEYEVVRSMCCQNCFFLTFLSYLALTSAKEQKYWNHRKKTSCSNWMYITHIRRSSLVQFTSCYFVWRSSIFILIIFNFFRIVATFEFYALTASLLGWVFDRPEMRYVRRRKKLSGHHSTIISRPSIITVEALHENSCSVLNTYPHCRKINTFSVWLRNFY